MGAQTWLPLTEYSSKYRTSISTLRRRIKSSQLEFSYKDGKYFVKDIPLDKHPHHHPNKVVNAEPTQKKELPPPQPVSNSKKATASTEDNPVLATATQLLNELKAAYSQILQEKEKQMIRLKGEVTDLQTLVRVLESENQRLKSALEAKPLNQAIPLEPANQEKWFDGL